MHALVLFQFPSSQIFSIYLSNMLALIVIFLFLPKERLGSADVWQRESAMLALGAASEGCLEGLGPHLPALFDFLVQQQNADTPQLRSISCWVLGRFMRYSILF